MLSTTRQKTEARKSREMDMISDFDNMNVMIGNENINSIGKELANSIEGSVDRFDLETNSRPR